MRASALSKIFDKYIGPIILFIFSFLRVRKRIPSEIKSIGILKENAIGDTVLLTAIIDDIKQKYSEAKITLFLTESNAISKCFFDDSIEVKVISFKNPYKALQEIRADFYDVFIDFGAWPRINALLACFSRSSFKIGFQTADQHRHFAYDQIAVHSNHCHELENYKVLLLLLAIPQSTRLPRLPITADLPKEFTQNNYVVIHPWGGGANGYKREWSVENWQLIINHLKKSGINVYLSGSPAERELNEKFYNAHNMAGEHSFESLITILSQAKIVLSINTGIMHVAAALNVPLIGLSGPTNIVRWGALGEKSINLKPKSNECGFLNLGFEYEGQRQDCMALVKAQTVMMEIDKLI